MKLNKLIYPLMLALAVTLGTTGCKHKPVGITPLHDGGGMVGPGTGPETLQPGNPVNPEPVPGTVPIALNNDPNDINGMTPDRLALAKNTIHFAYDSAVIKKSEQVKLQDVAATLSANMSQKLLIEGNCDERGTEEYNRSLGERRALAAREALAKLGVDPMRIFTRSYGKDKPAADGHDESAWSQNRRDDFVLLLPKSGS